MHMNAALDQVFAQAYDNPIPGYNTQTVGNLRLFEALAEHEFQLEYFNDGNFAKVQHCEFVPVQRQRRQSYEQCSRAQ